MTSSKTPAMFMEIAMGNVSEYVSLKERIDANVNELLKLHAKEDASLEEVTSVFHSLIHKVTEGITYGYETQARRAYSILTDTLPKFQLPPS